MIKKIIEKLMESYLFPLKMKVKILETENERLKSKNKNVLNLLAGDISPHDHNQRKDYISKITIFYKDIFEKKLQEIIKYQYQELGNIDNSGNKDLIHKGTINALYLVDEWFQECVGEQAGYNSELSNLEESAEDIKKRLKNKLQ